MAWTYKIKSSSGSTIKSGKTYKNSTDARKSAHRRLHQKDIPGGSYSEVSKKEPKPTKKKGWII